MTTEKEDKEVIEQFFEEAKQELETAHGLDPMLAVKAVLTENSTLRELANSNHRLFLVTALVALCAVGVAFAGWSRDTEFRYFYINQEGHVYETHGLTYPTITKARVTNFASEIATGFHTWTYRDYQTNFTSLIDNCADGVVEHYYNRLGGNGVLADAERFKKRYESVVTASRVVQERVIDSSGAMEWRVNLLLNEEVFGTAQPTSRNYDVVIDVRQVPLSVSPSGIQCSRYDENYRK